MENVNVNNGQNNSNFNNSFKRFNGDRQNFDTVNVKAVETPQEITVKTCGVKKFLTPKTAAYVGGALVVIAGGYLGYKHFFKNKKKSDDTPKEENKTFEEVK